MPRAVILANPRTWCESHQHVVKHGLLDRRSSSFGTEQEQGGHQVRARKSHSIGIQFPASGRSWENQLQEVEAYSKAF
jgi:hypothetical protein